MNRFMVVRSALFVVVLLLAAEMCFATQPSLPVVSGLWPSDNLTGPGAISLVYFAKFNYGYGRVTFTAIPKGNLVYEGLAQWDSTVRSGDSITFRIPIIVPGGDTTGLEISISTNGNCLTSASCYFVTTGDSVRVYRVDPRVNRFPGDPNQVYIENEYRGKKLPNEPPAPKLPPKIVVHTPSDSEKMMQLEREPLTDADVQHIEVDSEIWGRRRGEYKFQKVESIVDQRAHDSVYYESLMQKYGDSVSYYVTVDLRDPRHYAFLDTLVMGRLEKTDSAGFYRTIMTKGQLWKAYKKGIPHQDAGIVSPDRAPVDTVLDESDAHPEKEENKESDTDKNRSLDTLLFFNFESLWQNSWIRYDWNQTFGEDYWADCTQPYVPAHSGQHSVWCAGYGDMSCGVHYDLIMDAWMKTANAVYIGGHENVKLSYWVWYETEYQWDYMTAAYSLENDPYWHTFYHPPYLTGSSNGWRHELLDVPAGHDSLYVGFNFWSDFDLCSYRGAFIDEVAIIGTPIVSRPNLTYTTPVGWDYPIVPSPDTGTHTVGPLFGNAPTYVDLAVRNEGIVESGPFSVAFYIDATIDTVFQFESLSAGTESFVVDYVANIGGGAHVLKVFIDYGGSVQEENEIDNLYEWGFNWGGPGTMTATGSVKYLDLNYSPPSANFARNVRVELWDDDDFSDDLLDSGWSDESGAFVLGPVANEDDLWSGKQDIYLKVCAENDAAFINHGHNGDRYCFTTATISEVPDGVFSFGNVIGDLTDCGSLYIMDHIKDGRDTWISIAQFDPGQVEVILADSGTFYWNNFGYEFIQIDTSTNPGGYPDTFDKDVILHEYGHKLEGSCYFFDQGGGTHTWCSKVSLSLAASEGFAHFWSGYVNSKKTLYNFYNNFANCAQYNLETGEFGSNGYFTMSCNDYGDTCEAAVAGMLWDLYDTIDDDYSFWTGTPGIGYQDGVADTYDNGIYAINDCLMYRYYAGHRPRDINQFWDVWFQNPTLGNNAVFWAVWFEHGTNHDLVPPAGSISINGGADITSSLIVDLSLAFSDTLSGMLPPKSKMCFSNSSGPWSDWEPYAPAKINWNLSQYGGTTQFGAKTVYADVTDAAAQHQFVSAQIEYVECAPGDANGDATINMADAVYIINYIFKGGPEPTPFPLASGDADGYCDVNIADVVYIISYIFRSGPPPVDCDAWIAACGRPIRL